MGIVVAYLVLAVVFFALSTGLYKPKRWHDLTDKHIKILRIGCFFGFLVILVKIAGKLVLE